MGFEVKKLHHESIVVCVIKPPLNFQSELSDLFVRFGEVMQGLPGPIYRILDVRELEMNFGDMMIGLAQETRSGLPGTLADPRVRSVVVVTPGTVAALGAQSTGQDQYGAHASHIVTSLDEALAYARAQLAEMA